MINKKKEGGFYASKVRLFLNEYDGVPLEEFCKAEGVSYSKMLNCLGWQTGQRPSVPNLKPRNPVKKTQPVQSQAPLLELRELVVDDHIEDSGISYHFIENISISINNRIGVNIGKCDVTTLSALIREMEVSR